MRLCRMLGAPVLALAIPVGLVGAAGGHGGSSSTWEGEAVITRGWWPHTPCSACPRAPGEGNGLEAGGGFRVLRWGSEDPREAMTALLRALALLRRRLYLGGPEFS